MYNKEKRRKRGPTEYNLFISKTLKEIAKEHPHLGRNERMKLAQEIYHNTLSFKKYFESHKN